MKTYDEDVARLCKAIRENDETETLNRAVGLTCDVLNMLERLTSAVERIADQNRD